MKKKFKYDIEKNKKILHESIHSVILAASIGILCNLLFRLSLDLHLTEFGKYCALTIVICFGWVLGFGVEAIIYCFMKRKQEKEKVGEQHENK